jgi:diguanylate cyclase (GGDEF)-like protein
VPFIVNEQALIYNCWLFSIYRNSESSMIARIFGRSTVEASQRENDRLAALQQLDILDTPRDEGFERFVRIIQETFTVDSALVSFLDGHRQWYKACVGFEADEVAREDTFCQFVVDEGQPLVVPDTSLDPRFASHPAVTGEAHIRFYAGVPLKTPSGHTVGTVCAIDRRPRSFSNRDLRILQEIAGAAMDRAQLLQSVGTDSLTGAMTRRAFKEGADRILSSAVRHQHDVACIVLDVDHFKNVNDTYGHAAGDDVLRYVVAICQGQLRAGDLLGRMGGEEFAVLLPHINRDEGLGVAERLRVALAESRVKLSSGETSVTASFGATALSLIAKDIDAILAQADAAMYQAKSGGRNKCLLWNDIGVDRSSRRRVLKAGMIIFNDRRSTLNCTVRSLGTASANIVVSNSAAVPPEFTLAIQADTFETKCRVLSQDRHHLEVEFR